jgi:hypothetical protein
MNPWNYRPLSTMKISVTESSIILVEPQSERNSAPVQIHMFNMKNLIKVLYCMLATQTNRFFTDPNQIFNLQYLNHKKINFHP